MDTLKDKLEEIFKNKTFSQNIYYDIFKIFKNKAEPYSSNLNGVFINLNDCKENTLQEVYQYIQNIEKNNQEHENYLHDTEKKLDDLKKSIKDTTKKDIKIPKIKKIRQKNTASNKILDKELQPEKIIYKGVYKRLDSCMRGYKTKPITSKKENTRDVVFETNNIQEDYIEEADIEDTDIEETGQDYIEDNLNNEEDDLFGESDSDSEQES